MNLRKRERKKLGINGTTEEDNAAEEEALACLKTRGA